jgi:hypothetical protein
VIKVSIIRARSRGAWPHPGGVGSDNVGAGPEGCGSREDGGCQLGSSHGDREKFNPLLEGDSVKVRAHPAFPQSTSLGLGCSSTPGPYSPKLGWIAHACGRKDALGGWKGTMSGDRRSFAQVLRVRLAPVVMVPPWLTRGWGRSGFRFERGGRGDG